MNSALSNPAWSTSAKPSPEPTATGTDFALSCQAHDAEVTVRARTVTVDFSGHCTLRAEGIPGDTGNTIAVRLTDLQLVAELPDAGGPEDGGTITLELSDTSAGATGRARMVSPTEFDFLLVADLAATVDQPSGTIRLIARKPMELTATSNRFPPHGARFRLDAAVEFAIPDQHPEATTARLHELVLCLDTPVGG